MNTLVLSRKQIEQLHKLISEYPNEDIVTLTVDGSSGIGYSISANVKYASDTREARRDITDYEKW